MEFHVAQKVSHDSFVHCLDKGQVYPYDENEYLVKYLNKLPKNFKEMTLFDIDGQGSVYKFSRIVTYYEGKLKCLGAVYRNVLAK